MAFNEDPNLDNHEDAAVEYDGNDVSNNETHEIDHILNRNDAMLFAISGVVGAGIRYNQVGDAVIYVNVRDESVRDQVPSSIEGVTVEVDVTGDIEAY